jgi:hypothetical protein
MAQVREFPVQFGDLLRIERHSLAGQTHEGATMGWPAVESKPFSVLPPQAVVPAWIKRPV